MFTLKLEENKVALYYFEAFVDFLVKDKTGRYFLKMRQMVFVDIGHLVPNATAKIAELHGQTSLPLDNAIEKPMDTEKKKGK